MFSKKDDKSASRKKRFWPWGRKSEDATVEQAQPAEEAKVEAPAEPQTATVAPQQEVKPAPAEVKVETPSQPVVAPAPVVEARAESSVEAKPAVEAKTEEKQELGSSSQPEPAIVPKAEETVVKCSRPAPASPSQPVQAQTPVEVVDEKVAEKVMEAAVEEQPEPVQEGSFFSRMKSGLAKTRSSLVQGVTTLFIGKKEIDDELLEDLETQLLISDVGIEATRQIIDGLIQRIAYKELDDADVLIDALKAELSKILEPADRPLIIDTTKKPYVILVVGVNGVGKTTTIGKMARQFQMDGKKVMLAAGDTFRAAAVEQLQVWGDRNNIPVIAQHTGSDSASVLFDALEAAKARQADILIADTAGRLHNKDNLMEELTKIKRVLGKIDPEAPHEVLLVVDAGTGQNALSQAHLFDKAVGLTGIALTKLDGTAKGGVTFALSREMGLPIRFLGVGEQIEDLRPFNAKEFVDALFSDLDI